MTALDLHHVPLTDDRTLQEGLEGLLAPVVGRQLWVLFLDERDVLTGPLMPTDDYPLSPLAHYPDAGEFPADDRPAAQVIAECFARVVDEFGLSQLVLVWERPGPAGLDTPTRKWAHELGARFRGLGVRVRAQCLLSNAGLRVIPLDDVI